MIRPETDCDIAAVREVLTSVFPGPAEAKLVDDLRAAGDLVLCLKTPYDGPHLLAKALGEPGRRACGEVRYAPAFAALG